MNLLIDLTAAVHSLLNTDIPYAWELCKLKNNKELCVLVNSTFYLTVYFAFVAWWVLLVLRRLQIIAGRRVNWSEMCIIIAIAFFAVKTIWTPFLHINHFFACNLYPWTASAIVLWLYRTFIPSPVTFLRTSNVPTTTTHSDRRQSDLIHADTPDPVHINNEDQRQDSYPSVERQGGPVSYAHVSSPPSDVAHNRWPFNNDTRNSNALNTSVMRNNVEEDSSASSGAVRNANETAVRLQTVPIPSMQNSPLVRASTIIPRSENSSEFPVAATASIPNRESSTYIESNLSNTSNSSIASPSVSSGSDFVRKTAKTPTVQNVSVVKAPSERSMKIQRAAVGSTSTSRPGSSSHREPRRTRAGTIYGLPTHLIH